jgi:Xaa-Pro aminopeptidase
MYFDEAPIVAIGPNASNPHYAPTKDCHSLIEQGDLVLIDMWAKFKAEGSVYADITWMGYVGLEVPEAYRQRFSIVKGARDAAIAFLKRELPLRNVQAFEVDQVARKVIEEAGYGEYFTHRLGHSIHCDDSPHGPGANLDDFESHDTRTLLSGTSFSDEPGIYAPDFGVRSETDLRIENHRLLVVGGLQDEIIPLLKD